MNTLLFNSDYVVRDSGRIIRNGAVYVEGSTIADVGQSAKIMKSHRADLSIDCKGCTIIPGLVNSHNHLYQVAARGIGKSLSLGDWLTTTIYAIAKGLDDEDYYDACLYACAEAARGGTTAMIDLAGHHARDHSDSIVKAMLDFGMRGAVARGAVTAPGEKGPTPADEEVRRMRRFLDKWKRSGLVRPWVGPATMTRCEPETLEELKRLATENGAGFHMHMAESRAMVQEAKSRGFAGEIAWASELGLLDERTLIAHAVWITDPEIEVVRRAGAKIAHNPCSNQILASGVAPVPRMLKRGVTVSLATDGPASNDSLDMVAEMKAAILMARATTLDPKAMDSRDAFRMATEFGGKALLEPKVGSISAGSLADLACIQIRRNPTLEPQYDPLDIIAYSRSGRDVRLTMIDGKIVYQDESFGTIAFDDAARKLERVVQKVNGLVMVARK